MAVPRWGATADWNGQVASNTFEAVRAFQRESYKHIVLDWPAGAEIVSGSGTTTVNGDRVLVATGTTHASTAGRRVQVATGPGAVATSFSLNWAKKFSLGFWLVWSSGGTGTNLTVRVQLTQATTIGNLAAHGLGLQTNGVNINLATYGANGAQQLVSAATNLVVANATWVLLEHDPASQDRLRINGTLTGAVQSVAGDIPSTEPAVGYQLMLSVARTGGADVGDENIIMIGAEVEGEF